MAMSEGLRFRPGHPTVKLAQRSFESFQKAAAVWKALGNATLITLPVSKELISQTTPGFHGHTEVIARLYKREGVMCMYHPLLSVIPLTQHIPFKKVPRAISRLDVESLGDALLFFTRLLKPRRPFAMTGLNPHAGENGKIGDEESLLKEYIRRLRSRKIDMSGPYPADGLFIEANRRKYSLIAACSHDQALIPFKALFGAQGINITLNLPALRVSPDHGPAYEFAGKNGADSESVFNSLVFALDYGEKWIEQFCYPS